MLVSGSVNARVQGLGFCPRDWRAPSSNERESNGK